MANYYSGGFLHVVKPGVYGVGEAAYFPAGAVVRFVPGGEPETTLSEKH
jgi:hypothetical protein